VRDLVAKPCFSDHSTYPFCFLSKYSLVVRITQAVCSLCLPGHCKHFTQLNKKKKLSIVEMWLSATVVITITVWYRTKRPMQMISLTMFLSIVLEL
jgi:hypothetical protein